MRAAAAWRCPCSSANALRACSGMPASASTSASSSLELVDALGTTRPNSAASPACVGQHRLLLDQQGPHRVQGQRRPAARGSSPARTSPRAGDAAAHSAAASAASFFLPRFTNGRAASGAISFTSCPSPLSTRAQWWAAPQASMTTVQRGCASKNAITSSRRSLRLSWTLALRVDAMDLEAGLGGVDANHANAHRGRLL